LPRGRKILTEFQADAGTKIHCWQFLTIVTILAIHPPQTELSKQEKAELNMNGFLLHEIN